MVLNYSIVKIITRWTVGGKGKLLIVPATRLYNRSSTFEPSALVHPRIMEPYIELNSADADKMSISAGDVVEVKTDAATVRVKAYVNGNAPEGSAILPRYLSAEATPMTITVGEVAKV